jgi:pyrroline-5-carboxylate reductase
MTICFVGGGNMAGALIGGLLKRGYIASKIKVVEISADKCALIHQEYGVRATTELETSVEHSHILVLAVKPQQLREVATRIAPLLSGQLIISIAAGIRSVDLAGWIKSTNIVRAMPNMPALIRSGVTGLFSLPEVSEAHRHDAQSILMAVGNSLWLKDEIMMDAITAITGSGPAYVFYFIEAMQQAARELGFNDEDGRNLVIDTFLGATRLAQASNVDVSELRAQVTSKNGTTERALLSMESNALKQHIVAAVHAAAARSKELGDELGKAS